MKACHTPQTKLHQKMLQATQVIISLVREKQLLSTHIEHLISATPLSSNWHGQEGRLEAKREFVEKSMQTNPSWQCGQGHFSSGLLDHCGQGCVRGGGGQSGESGVGEDDKLGVNQTWRDITGAGRGQLDCGDFQVRISEKKDHKKESVPGNINMLVADGEETSHHTTGGTLTGKTCCYYTFMSYHRIEEIILSLCCHVIG